MNQASKGLEGEKRKIGRSCKNSKPKVETIDTNLAEVKFEQYRGILCITNWYNPGMRTKEKDGFGMRQYKINYNT